jgi:hypothetical protein
MEKIIKLIGMLQICIVQGKVSEIVPVSKSYHRWFLKINCALALCVDRSLNCHENPLFSSSAYEDGKQWLAIMWFFKNVTESM